MHLKKLEKKSISVYVAPSLPAPVAISTSNQAPPPPPPVLPDNPPPLRIAPPTATKNPPPTLHKASIHRIAIQGVLIDICAKVCITQYYSNETDSPVEISFSFPVDVNAAICGYNLSFISYTKFGS